MVPSDELPQTTFQIHKIHAEEQREQESQGTETVAQVDWVELGAAATEVRLAILLATRTLLLLYAWK